MDLKSGRSRLVFLLPSPCSPCPPGTHLQVNELGVLLIAEGEPCGISVRRSWKGPTMGLGLTLDDLGEGQEERFCCHEVVI